MHSYRQIDHRIQRLSTTLAITRTCGWRETCTFIFDSEPTLEQPQKKLPSLSRPDCVFRRTSHYRSIGHGGLFIPFDLCSNVSSFSQSGQVIFAHLRQVGLLIIRVHSRYILEFPILHFCRCGRNTHNSEFNVKSNRISNYYWLVSQTMHSRYSVTVHGNRTTWPSSNGKFRVSRSPRLFPALQRTENRENQRTSRLVD